MVCNVVIQGSQQENPHALVTDHNLGSKEFKNKKSLPFSASYTK